MWAGGEVGVTNIDRVINGLKCCTSDNNQTKCRKCPYWGSNDGFSECSKLKEDALKLLKEQEKEIENAFQREVDAGAEAQWAPEHI